MLPARGRILYNYAAIPPASVAAPRLGYRGTPVALLGFSASGNHQGLEAELPTDRDSRMMVAARDLGAALGIPPG